MARHDEGKGPPPTIRASSLSNNLGYRVNDALEGEILLGEAELFAGNAVAVTATRVILAKAGILAGNSTRVIPMLELQKVVVSSMKGMSYLEFQTLEPITDANRLSWSVQTGPTSRLEQTKILELIVQQREQARAVLFEPLGEAEKQKILAEEAFRAQTRAQLTPAAPPAPKPLKATARAAPKKQGMGLGGFLLATFGGFILLGAIISGMRGVTVSSSPPPVPVFDSSAPDPVETPAPVTPEPDPVATPTPVISEAKKGAVGLLYALAPGESSIDDISSGWDDAHAVCPEKDTDLVILVSDLHDSLKSIGQPVPVADILRGLVAAKPSSSGLNCQQIANILLEKMRAR